VGRGPSGTPVSLGKAQTVLPASVPVVSTDTESQQTDTVPIDVEARQDLVVVAEPVTEQSTVVEVSVVHESAEPESELHFTVLKVAVVLLQLEDEDEDEGVDEGLSVGVPDGFSGTGSGPLEGFVGIGWGPEGGDSGAFGSFSAYGGGPTSSGGGPGGTGAFGSFSVYGGGSPGGHGVTSIPKSLMHFGTLGRSGRPGSFGRLICADGTLGSLKPITPNTKKPPGGPGGPGRFPTGIGTMKNGKGTGVDSPSLVVVIQPPPAVRFAVLEICSIDAPAGRTEMTVSTVRLAGVVVVGKTAGGVMVGLAPKGSLVDTGSGTTIGSPCASVVVVEFIEEASGLTEDPGDGTNGVTGPRLGFTAVVLLPPAEAVEFGGEPSGSTGSAGEGAVGPRLGSIAVVFQPPLVSEGSCVEFDDGPLDLTEDAGDGTSGVISAFVVGLGPGFTTTGAAVPVPIMPELPNGEEEFPASNVADAFHVLSCDPFGLRPPVPVGLTVSTVEPEPTSMTGNGVTLGSLMKESAGSVVAAAS
jgi:hypothetical protein